MKTGRRFEAAGWKAAQWALAGLMAGALAVSLTTPRAHAEQITTDQRLINDYPTVARADYIFGCMAANGQTRDVLERCACSIDIVATILPYEEYVSAETILSVGRVGGEKTSMFKTSPALQKVVAELRRAQAEAEFRCF